MLGKSKNTYWAILFGSFLLVQHLAGQYGTGLILGGFVSGIAGALIGMGIPEYEAKRYQGGVKNRAF